jgi:MscS family membrane protein
MFPPILKDTPVLNETYEALRQLPQVSLGRIIVIALFIIIGVLMRKVFSKWTLVLIRRMTRDRETLLTEDMLVTLMGPLSLFFVIAALYAAGSIVTLPPRVGWFYTNMLQSLLTYTIFWAFYALVEPILHVTNRKRNSSLSEEVRDFSARFLKIMVVLLGILSVLQIWGINVAAFLAGLGLLGMAVAFAAQETIKNFFGCLSILVGQTFKKGDRIQTPEVDGIVEHIGFRTTSIRQIDKALVMIPNAKLADVAVINFAKMTHRQILWKVSLSTDTPTDALGRIAQKVRTYLQTNPAIDADPKNARAIIHYDSFSEYAVELVCDFYTRTTDYIEYMAVKEECLLAVKRIIEEEGGLFATSAYYCAQKE